MDNSGSQVTIWPSEINGEITISGAKNAALKLQTATILTDSRVTLTKYPAEMLDIQVQEEMLSVLGKQVVVDGDKAHFSGKISNNELLWEKRSIRNTLLILGCLLTKTGYGKVPLPGGCKLGERKYDIHVDLMKAFGADVWDDDNYLVAKNKNGSKLKACEFELPMRSTGATENAILMASLAEGTSRIWNPHIRPEIIDLIEFLKSLGAKIEVRGQESIIIEGVSQLNREVEYDILEDNMQALTYLIAGGLTAKELLIRNFPITDLEVPLTFLRHAGLKYYEYKNEVIVRKCEPYPVDIATGPYPGINSDMQPLFAAWGIMSKGKSTITDLRFVGRYGYMDEMAKMGVQSSVDNNRLIINGGNAISGAEVTAVDLRAGAALMILALVAEGKTTINDFWMIERGYNNVLSNINKLGVKTN